MILTLDIGNTETTIGIFDDEEIVAHWRVSTHPERTVDEYGLLLRTILRESHADGRIRGAAVRSYVSRLAERFDRDAVDARLVFRGVRPWTIRERWGRKVDRPLAAKAIVRALARNRRDPIRLRFKAVRPRETRRSLTWPAIVIHRESRLLRLYRGTRLWRTFGIAVGQSSYPTPIGLFEIAVMWRNPWWYPPDSDWARGSSPVPPGPGNPLGTRWMGLSAPGVGIHGTPDAASIGYSASHGCIRMHIPSAEWLFNHVSIGTPVYIVPA
jgi:lipoprotein-anchoring transpeptidase ErfK/SrfK